MGRINPENHPNQQEVKEDIRARAYLDATTPPIELRFHNDLYKKQAMEMINDLSNGYFLQSPNEFEDGEYKVVLEHGKTGQTKNYFFEVPLPLESLAKVRREAKEQKQSPEDVKDLENEHLIELLESWIK